MQAAPAACDVATIGTEGLCKGAHHDVDVLGVYPRPLCATPASLAQGSYAVRLIQEQVGLQIAIRLNYPDPPKPFCWIIGTETLTGMHMTYISGN